MKLLKLIPNIFYADIKVGLHLFVECLGFSIGYDDLKGEEPFCVVNKDGLAAHLIESAEFAEKDRPELRIETDDIEALYKHVSTGFPALLHPNLKTVTLRPWKALEFALLDASGVCIIIQQWPDQQ